MLLETFTQTKRQSKAAGWLKKLLPKSPMQKQKLAEPGPLSRPTQRTSTPTLDETTEERKQERLNIISTGSLIKTPQAQISGREKKMIRNRDANLSGDNNLRMYVKNMGAHHLHGP